MVEAVFWDAPEMVSIVSCESGFTHYLPSGKLLTSKTNDGGVMQLNATAHGSTMRELGLDASNIYDNLSFARRLYDSAGDARDWVCSHKVALR
jgi:hypothetical protein